MNSNKINWSQIEAYKRTGILHSVYEHGIPLMTIPDFLNITSTCWEWKKSFKYYKKEVKNILLLSQPLFQRLIKEVKKIDRSESPKFWDTSAIVFGSAINGGHIDIHETKIPQTQREYEIAALDAAYEKRKGFSFESMSDEDRNNFLNTMARINPSDLINVTQVKENPIGSLIEAYSCIKMLYDQIEFILLFMNKIEVKPAFIYTIYDWLTLLLSVAAIFTIVYCI